LNSLILLNWLDSRSIFFNDESVKRDEGIAPLRSF